MAAALFPRDFPTIMIEAKFAAGPAMRRTKAAPGLSPLSISERAIGMEPVEHTYIGTATITTAIIDNNGYPAKNVKKHRV